MAEGGPGRGRGGRGLIIARLLELQQQPGQLQKPATTNVHDTNEVQEQAQSRLQETALRPLQEHVQRPIIGGRGAMFLHMQQAIHEQPRIQPPSASPLQQPQLLAGQPASLAQSPEPGGRGRMLEMRGLVQLTQAPPIAMPQPTTTVGAVTNQFRRIEITSDKPPVVMRGKQGKEINATANYIPLYLQAGRGVYEYEVRFSPPVDDRQFCDQLLFVQHKELLGRRRRTFDGVTLYLPNKLEEETTKLTSIHPITNETHIISLIFRRERSMGECTHMYNVLFNSIQRELSLVKLGREYFSQELAYPIPQHRLEIWPGYVTAVDAFEGGIMLNCNASHKVLRTQTVLDLIQDIVHSSARDWKERLQKQIIGQSVMTRRPVNIYRIDDIDFNQNPTSTFTKPDGTTMDYIEYHRRKNIVIKDKQQPLLVHRPKPSKRPGGSGLLMLIPELCYLTGLTDEMRADFKVMKDVAMFTRVNPNQRLRALQTFIDNIKNTPSCVKLLDEWGLKVPEQTIELTARILNPEQLQFGKGYIEKGSNQADWSRAATSNDMLEVVNISDWMVVFTQRDERNSRDFVEMMKRVCPQMGVKIEYPTVEKIHDDKTETYLRTMRERLTGNCQLVVIIFPSARDDRYSAIKKLCCVDRPIPSQVINSRTISRPDKLRSIVQKIALQINCKLGGALWAVNIPFKNAMICGIDTYHDTKIRAQSVAGFVASMNTSVTRWYSQVFIQSSDREMVDGLQIALCTALNKYYEVNNEHPDNVVIFRDGVGDGQLKVCEEHEVKALQKAFSTISPDYQPSLAFIVCQKRINTRIFLPKNGAFENPPPGSVVDHTITRRYMYDFFLVSQLVRQGTVTPTHYIILHNSTRLDPDKIQKLTYKMCHLYYNWPGTIRVPAPCQYAHKLAHLVGCSIHKEPARILCDKLFFL